MGFPHRRHLPGHFAAITTIVATRNPSQKQMIVPTGFVRYSSAQNGTKHGESHHAVHGVCPKGDRPVAIQRAAVDFDTPQVRAAARTVSPGMATVVGAFRGLPNRVP